MEIRDAAALFLSTGPAGMVALSGGGDLFVSAFGGGPALFSSARDGWQRQCGTGAGNAEFYRNNSLVQGRALVGDFFARCGGSGIFCRSGMEPAPAAGPELRGGGAESGGTYAGVGNGHAGID